jgi:C4-dicarboxylate-specific signal transduction histidine kinase
MPICCININANKKKAIKWNRQPAASITSTKNENSVLTTVKDKGFGMPAKVTNEFSPLLYTNR